uniref:NSUN5/RCM1 N-terminal domain-containing protein n=1 Tax=Lactuca sativa TaxID=4236 RepID=A0A9R1XVW3_LACSA|nr:hypothetical protein LSAT_V11C100039500 [Lactuca sativa]
MLESVKNLHAPSNHVILHVCITNIKGLSISSDIWVSKFGVFMGFEVMEMQGALKVLDKMQDYVNLPIIKDVLEIANVLNSKWKRQVELMYIITYDILFGQDSSLTGDPEKYLILRKSQLQSALAKILLKKGAKRIEDLMSQYKIPDVKKPCYVRVNTLKLDVETAVPKLSKDNMVEKDDMIPDLLVLPPATDLHNHPLGRMNFADESPKLPPSPGGHIGQLSPNNSIDSNSNTNTFSLEFGNGEFTGLSSRKSWLMRNLQRLLYLIPNEPKERKMRYITELEHKVQTLQTEAT